MKKKKVWDATNNTTLPAHLAFLLPDRSCSMRRRKKDKAVQKDPVSSTEDTLESSARGLSVKFAKNVEGGGGTSAENRSPPVQPRKRSLLGSLGSVRDLVEQVGGGGFMVGVLPAVQFSVIIDPWTAASVDLVFVLTILCARCFAQAYHDDTRSDCGLQQTAVQRNSSSNTAEPEAEATNNPCYWY